MATYIVFTRAINVDKRFIKMSDLREGLSHRGFVAVESHILSGNLRLRSSLRSTAKVEQSVEKAMQELCGFEVRTIVRTPEQLGKISSYGASLLSPLAGDVQRYVTFLKEEPDDELIATMNGWDFAGERAHINGREVYVWLSHLSHKAKAPPAAALHGSAGRTCPKTSRSGAREWAVSVHVRDVESPATGQVPPRQGPPRHVAALAVVICSTAIRSRRSTVTQVTRRVVGTVTQVPDTIVVAVPHSPGHVVGALAGVGHTNTDTDQHAGDSRANSQRLDPLARNPVHRLGLSPAVKFARSLR